MKKILIKTTDEQLMLITHAEYLDALDSAERFGGVAGFQVVGEVTLPHKHIAELTIEAFKKDLLVEINKKITFDPNNGIQGQQDLVERFTQILLYNAERVAAIQKVNDAQSIRVLPIVNLYLNMPPQ